MAYGSILAIHIIGACVTGIVGASAGAALWLERDAGYRPHAVVLGLLAGFEILTGIALSVVSIDITALSLCRNVALYLTGVFAVEALLFMRMQNVAMAFPTRLALSPIAFSLVLMASAISYGF